jgi:hypothetical protein
MGDAGATRVSATRASRHERDDRAEREQERGEPRSGEGFFPAAWQSAEAAIGFEVSYAPALGKPGVRSERPSASRVSAS